VPTKWGEVFFLLAGLIIWVMGIPAAHAQVDPHVRIVANVELVQVPVVVFDDKGAVASKLKKGDFRLLEDGVEQKILYLGIEHPFHS
jgi:hypothetical protein